MGFWCFALTYMLRVCLNIAITQMVKDKNTTDTHLDPDRCPDKTMFVKEINEFRNTPYTRYEWDEELQGIIL